MQNLAPIDSRVRGVLDAAADVLEKHGWIRHHQSNNVKREMLQALNEAIVQASGVGITKVIHDVLLRSIQMDFPDAGSITDYNDCFARSKEEVMGVLRSAAIRVEEGVLLCNNKLTSVMRKGGGFQRMEGRDWRGIAPMRMTVGKMKVPRLDGFSYGGPSDEQLRAIEEESEEAS